MGVTQSMCSRHPQEPARYRIWYKGKETPVDLCRECAFEEARNLKAQFFAGLYDPDLKLITEDPK